MVLAAGAMRRSCGVVARRDRLRGDVAARSTNRVSKHVNQSRVVHQPHLHRLSHRDKKSRCPWSTATGGHRRVAVGSILLLLVLERPLSPWADGGITRAIHAARWLVRFKHVKYSAHGCNEMTWDSIDVNRKRKDWKLATERAPI